MCPLEVSYRGESLGVISNGGKGTFGPDLDIVYIEHSGTGTAIISDKSCSPKKNATMEFGEVGSTNSIQVLLKSLGLLGYYPLGEVIQLDMKRV